MIDVGNDSVVAVWKSYVCFPPVPWNKTEQQQQNENKSRDRAVDETLT